MTYIDRETFSSMRKIESLSISKTMSRIGLSHDVKDLKIYIKISKRDELTPSNIFLEEKPLMSQFDLDLDFGVKLNNYDPNERIKMRILT